MNNEENKVRAIVFVSSTRMDAHGDLVDEFMSEVFDINGGFFSDETSLGDFWGEVTDPWPTITALYGVTKEEVGSELVVDVLDAIKLRMNPQ